MSKSRKASIMVVFALLFCLPVANYLISRSQDDESATPLAPIARPDVPDAVLGGGPIDTVDGGASDNWLFKQTSFHPGTRDKRVVKSVFSNRQGPGYLHPTGHFVLYEFYRADGTLERDELVSPEPNLSSSVITKRRIREFDSSGTKEIRSENIRENGTIGAVSFPLKNLHLEYRADGKTLRNRQEYVDGDHYRNTFFRPDGKTPWWITDYSEPARVKVFLDLDGKPYEREFTRRHLKDGYSAGPDTKPFPYLVDTYRNADGKREFEQVWSVVWDDRLDTTREVLSTVVFYDPDGKSITRRVDMDITDQSGKFIKEVVEYHGDGSVLTRKYRSPGCRWWEQAFVRSATSKNWEVINTDFDETDSYVESFDARALQGFDHKLYGTYDDDSHDK